MIKTCSIALLLTLGACATTGGVTGVATTAVVNVDKALIVADTAYHAAEQTALAAVNSGTLSPVALASIGTASDAAYKALHNAEQVRTSAAVAVAMSSIALFSTAAGAK